MISNSTFLFWYAFKSLLPWLMHTFFFARVLLRKAFFSPLFSLYWPCVQHGRIWNTNPSFLSTNQCMSPPSSLKFHQPEPVFKKTPVIEKQAKNCVSLKIIFSSMKLLHSVFFILIWYRTTKNVPYRAWK